MEVKVFEMFFFCFLGFMDVMEMIFCVWYCGGCLYEWRSGVESCIWYVVGESFVGRIVFILNGDM